MAPVKSYFVYMLLCRDDSFYVGITSDVERRIGQHNTGWDPKAYTHERRPVRLVHCSEFREIDDAIAWEKQLKGWSRAKKAALINEEWDDIRRLAKRRAGRQPMHSFEATLRVAPQDDT